MRILIVRLSSLGDIVHAVPAVAGLHAAQPEAEIVWAVQEVWAPLMARLPFPVRTVGFARHGGLRGFLDTARTLRALQPDVALDLQGNWKSALVTVASGAARRFGPRQRREPGSSLLLVRRAATSGGEHATDRALDVVRMAAPAAQRQDVDVTATEAERDRERTALRTVGIDPERPFLVLLSGRPEDPRTWPRSAQIELARRAPWPAVFVSGPREADLPRFEGFAHLHHGRGELLRLVALGDLVRRAGGAVLGGDGGALHVLALAGARVLGLFGAQDPLRTGPVRGESLITDNPPHCLPCRRRRCHHPRGPVCMTELSVGRVVARLWPTAPAGEGM